MCNIINLPFETPREEERKISQNEGEGCLEEKGGLLRVIRLASNKPTIITTQNVSASFKRDSPFIRYLNLSLYKKQYIDIAPHQHITIAIPIC